MVSKHSVSGGSVDMNLVAALLFRWFHGIRWILEGLVLVGCVGFFLVLLVVLLVCYFYVAFVCLRMVCCIARLI